MTETQWEQLNSSWHHYCESEHEEDTGNQPPYADQALALIILNKNNIINIDDALDYAAGYGTMARFLDKYFDKKLAIFDKFVRNESPELKYIEYNEITKYKLVINSAMFEHILDRSDLDYVNNLVAEDGVLMLHTVVCENVPADPNWFYITPIAHTAFHTNKSMNLLMEQWGYAASIYCPRAKSWFLFKDKSPRLFDLEIAVQNINRELQTDYLYYKKGFMDYWKGF